MSRLKVGTSAFLIDWPYWARTSKLRIQSPLPYQFGEWPLNKNHPHGDRTRNSGLRGRRLNQFDQWANYFINLHLISQFVNETG
jgi:hypothetical protein